MKKIVLALFVFALLPVSWAQVVLFQATLLGSGEIPPVASSATGIATGSFNVATNVLSFSETWSGLSAPSTASHIHRAPLGTNGPIVIPFSSFPVGVTAGTFADTFTLTAPQAADLLAGLYYVNIHSTQFPGGEIRGQFLAVPGAVPEPGAYALAGAALLGALMWRRAGAARQRT